MNSLLSPFRPSPASPALKPGVPFSTRLVFGAPAARATGVLGNRAFVRAWVARQMAKAAPPARRPRSA
jgi:hypothetical protein